MYFNDEKNSTNIDKEFEGNKKFNFDINILKNKYVLIGIGCFLVLIFMIFIFSKKPVVETEYFLELEGLTDMTIYQDSVFIDPGYKAYDNKGMDYTLDVSVLGLVDTSVVGEYIIEYQFNDIVKRRVVTVLGDVTHVTYLNLLGTSIVYLKLNEEYHEPGYMVLDTVETNLEDKVKVSGYVNAQKAGVYKLIYSVTNSSGVMVSTERTVIVMDSDISLSYSPIEITNKDVTINVNVVSNYFDYVLLPDGTKSVNRLTSYIVSANGEYKFVVYSKDGSFKESVINITNIDKIKPIINNCSAKINNGGTNIVVNSVDQGTGINIYNYYVNNRLVKNSAVNNYIYLGTNVDNVKVSVVDKAGNISEKVCSVIKPLPSSSSSSKNSSSSSKNSSSSSKKSSSSSKKSSSGSDSGKLTYSGGTTYYSAFGYQYIVPKTKNDLQTFVNKVENRIAQTALDTCHDQCLGVSLYHAYMIQHGNLNNLSVEDACDWRHSSKLKSKFYDTSKEVLYKVYEEINDGKVIVIQVKGGSGRHFALVVGYRSRVKRKEDMTEADLLIIDSWDGLLETMDKSISSDGRYLWKRSDEGWRVDIFK